MNEDSSLGIEYAHIYIDQQYSDEHELGIDELKSCIKSAGKHAKITKVVLIDDYSPGIVVKRFDADAFIQKLADSNAKPDVVVFESKLVAYCERTIELVENKRVKKNLLSYYETRKKYPCSLFIASWYLLRLGVFGRPDIDCVLGSAEQLLSDRLITILPDNFETPEQHAIDIIRATKHADQTANIQQLYFEKPISTYSDWDEFDPFEYVERNYGRLILPEDKSIIDFVVDFLAELNLEKGSLDKVADIGAGPNLYPSLLLSPFLSPKCSLDLIEYSHSNLKYLTDTIASIQKKHSTPWKRFESYILSLQPDTSLMQVAENAHVVEGSIFELPNHKYDAIMSFFVSESITDSLETFSEATKSLMGALKPNGIFIIAHMIGSHGYFAGERTSFPAVNITLQQLEKEYLKYGHFKSHLVGHENREAARKGYKGMAVFVGQKNSNS